MKRPRTQQFLLFSLLTLVISAGTLALVDADDLVRLSRNVPGESTPIIVDADEITTWVDGNVHVMLLRGQVLVQHGIVRARFAEGVLLIDARRYQESRIWNVNLYAEGDVLVQNGTSSPIGLRRPGGPAYARRIEIQFSQEQSPPPGAAQLSPVSPGPGQRAAAQDSPGNSASSSNPAIRFWEDHARNVPDGKTIQPPLAPVGMTPGSGANTPRPAFYTPAAPSPPLSSTLAPSPSAAAPSDSATLIVPVQASMPVNTPGDSGAVTAPAVVRPGTVAGCGGAVGLGGPHRSRSGSRP